MHAITQYRTFDLFTIDYEFTMLNLRKNGPMDPFDETPLVFKSSKINLNITLCSIKSGIPLRCFEIMGSGSFYLSFCLTNFQADFFDIFVPNIDFVYYEDKNDLLKKIDYYLKNEKEREEIAKSGHDKIAAAHTYRHRVQEILGQYL